MMVVNTDVSIAVMIVFRVVVATVKTPPKLLVDGKLALGKAAPAASRGWRPFSTITHRGVKSALCRRLSLPLPPPLSHLDCWLVKRNGWAHEKRKTTITDHTRAF
jgi:hypothetical protein